MDRLSAAVLLVLLLPVWVYWRIKAWVRGVPMLERRTVLGVKGRPFTVVGFERRLSPSPVIARLPALWNVLRHDLSLVGPRPILFEEIQLHEPWLANLCAMRPGLTGLWRLRGHELPVEERLALDLFYIRNYTVTLDLQILLQTVRELSRRLLGREHSLARWDDPRSTGGTSAGIIPRVEGASPTRARAEAEHRMPSIWSRS